MLADALNIDFTDVHSMVSKINLIISDQFNKHVPLVNKRVTTLLYHSNWDTVGLPQIVKIKTFNILIVELTGGMKYLSCSIELKSTSCHLFW